jgi:hypothetical protein
LAITLGEDVTHHQGRLPDIANVLKVNEEVLVDLHQLLVVEHVEEDGVLSEEDLKASI